ncbi:RNA polymerase sigma factor [Pedobacter aquatilis]|uniref:RNA polymerase sigma factor n=1 Tax=Pedobacter aquatilis TaxID=351343 RepID=UPI00292D56AA|nr:sigma-70 family RNA polymerase sigma factor [Pedobacter aquatilis]
MDGQPNLLISRIKQDDELAFNQLFDLYWEKLYGLAWARVNNADVAQDIVQELFIKLWQRRKSLDIKGSLSAYLHTAVKLSVISYFRSVSKEELQLQDAATRMSIIQDAAGDLEDYLLLEHLIAETVAKMPELLQQVYTMRNESKSIKEIAADLGIAEQTVKNYTAEVLRRLRLVIQEKYPEKYAAYLSILIVLVNK